MDKNIQILQELREKNGLFLASRREVKTGYDKAWVRDNIYCALGLEVIDAKKAILTYQALFDIFLKHEYKIDHAIKVKPQFAFEYIHARYNPITLEEFYDDWGNKQNDAIGAFLFKVGDLLDKEFKVIRDENDNRILQKLVFYLNSVEYWHDKDSGMWEEDQEIHASSVGACVAGLKKISRYVYVPEDLIYKGEVKLNSLLPKESLTKKVDLALLSLIYPYNIVSAKQRDQILRNVEKHLIRKNGVIRYVGDKYYNDGFEASWTLGFVWLAIIYKQLGQMKKYKSYLSKTFNVMNSKGELPELYLSNGMPNENTPLAWAQSMLVIASA